MLYATSVGRIIGEEELNEMSLQEIERQGIHVLDEAYSEWS